jgi:hypothetical protein
MGSRHIVKERSRLNEVPMATLVQTDSRSRVVLPGHPDQMFQMQEIEDGSILLRVQVGS